MNFIINWKKHLFINLALGALFYFTNLPLWLNSLLGFGVILYCSFIIGQIFHRRQNLSLSNLIGFTYLAAFVTIFGFTAIHLQFFSVSYCWLLSAATAIISTVLLITKPIVCTLSFNDFPRPKNLIISFGFLLFSFIAFQQLYLNATDEALRSPWQVTPDLFFIAYALATFCLIFALRFSKTKTAFWNLLGLSLHFFLSICASIIIYKLGSDYDPFIHRANVDLLLANGQILPTPIYYLGQYVLIIFIHTLTNLNTNLIDTYLVPILSALLIPTLFYNLGRLFNLKNTVLLTLGSISLLVLPLKTFTITTPQSLANLFALTAIVFACMAMYKKVSLWPAWLAITITGLTHLIAGLPMAAILAFISIDRVSFFKKWPNKLILFLKTELLLATILILPIAFLFNAQKTSSQLKVDVISNPWQKLFDLLVSIPNIKILNYISVHDFIYNFYNLRWLLIIVLVVAGFYVTKNITDKILFKKLIISFVTLVLASGLLTISIDFFSLVSGEKNIYPQRLLELATYCLMPIMFFGIYGLWHKLNEQSRSQEIVGVIILVSFICTNVYLSFPRVDRIAESHGYSTSKTDIDTVKFIEKIANGEKYVVLAGQPVSAAAISTFGYSHYYNDYFYYPVPTGNRLYQLYEDLAFIKAKPSETINTARYITGVQNVYFVLNRYWSGADESIVFYKNTADAWYAIDDKNFIFVYKNNDVIDNMADKRLQEIKK